MKLLLDTHAFLWFVFDKPELSSVARALIGDFRNEIFLSMASIWEIGIKVGIQKLEIKEPLEPFITGAMRQNNFQLLPIELAHVTQVSTLPLHHRDPFDRLLAAQSLTEMMPILSGDSILDDYGLTRLW